MDAMRDPFAGADHRVARQATNKPLRQWPRVYQQRVPGFFRTPALWDRNQAVHLRQGMPQSVTLVPSRVSGRAWKINYLESGTNLADPDSAIIKGSAPIDFLSRIDFR
jgi:hypothetical protein